MSRSSAPIAPHPATDRPQARSPSAGPVARNDLRWVAVATLLTWLVSSVFELQERLAGWTAPLEAWEVDELPLALAALALGVAWYGWRRRQEANRLLAHNRVLAQQLITVQERERLVLARELHDELAQHCTAIRIEATYLQRACDIETICAAARRAAESATHMLDGVRGIVRRLRPAELDELGLVAALQSLARSCQARCGLLCTVQVFGCLDGLGANVDMAVYRVAQEALANVQRHAGARRATVSVQRQGDALVLQVEDDGDGFDPLAQTHGLGLLGAAERAAGLGGRLAVSSEAGGGTRIRMTLPVGAERTSAGAP
jgi:two-component system sensor histidine kinase UhpB